METIILGGGVTGLTVGHKFGYPVYEEKPIPGGLCVSYKHEGFSWDLGGHWIFGDTEIKSFINEIVPTQQYSRNAGVYLNEILPYPIQNALTENSSSREGTMKEWLSKKFSKELCNLFFFPFNHKYTEGLYDYVRQDDPKKTPRKGGGYNQSFIYPLGGIQELVNAFSRKCDLHLEKKASGVDIKDKFVYFSDGTSARYDRLISTIPLDMLLSLCGYSDYVLPYTSVAVLNIAAERGFKCPGNSWLYIPGTDQSFYRVGFYSNVEPSMAKPGTVSLYVERAMYSKREVEDNYIELVIKTLKEWKWIDNPVFCDLIYIKHAYTWLAPETRREQYLRWLADHKIISIGRYGKWRFQGIAESIFDGLGIAE